MILCRLSNRVRVVSISSILQEFRRFDDTPRNIDRSGPMHTIGNPQNSSRRTGKDVKLYVRIQLALQVGKDALPSHLDFL